VIEFHYYSFLTPNPSPSVSWERGASSACPERSEGKREAG
jgi:hypothetical protein